VAGNTCAFTKSDGCPCGAPPLRDGDYCFWHDASRADEVAEARKLGGQRRRRELVVGGAFDFEGLGSVGSIRRLIEVAAVDALGLENSISRARTLAYLAQTAARLLETGELEDRLAALEHALRPRLQQAGRRR
jgi:hypothetical protein